MSRIDLSIIAPMFARGHEQARGFGLDREQSDRQAEYLRLALRQQRMNGQRFAASEAEAVEMRRQSQAAREFYKRILPQYGIEVDPRTSAIVDQTPLDILEKSIDDLRRNRDYLDEREESRQTARQKIDQQMRMFEFVKARDPAAFSPQQEEAILRGIESGATMIAGPLVDLDRGKKPTPSQKQERRTQLSAIEKDLMTRMKQYDTAEGNAAPQGLVERLQQVQAEIDAIDDEVLGPMPGAQREAFPQSSFMSQPQSPLASGSGDSLRAPTEMVTPKDEAARERIADQVAAEGERQGWTDEEIEAEYNRRVRARGSK